MTKEQAKHLAEVLNAYADGKPIEVLLDGEWGEANLNEYSFDENESYRIKKHQPIGWLYWNNVFVHIPEIGVGYVEFDSCVYSFVEAFNNGFTFADGQPFGIKEY